MHDIDAPGTITVDRSGSVVGENESARKALRGQAGPWEVTGTCPGMVILRKPVLTDERRPTVLLSGEVNKDGWLIEVVNFISTSRLTGKLTVVGAGKIQRDLYFESGALRMAASSAENDLFGQFAVHEGVLNAAQLESALADQRATGKRLGQSLIDSGLLKGPELYQLVHKLVEKIFYDSIAVRDGVYHFVAGVDMSDLPVYMCIDTQALLLEGLKCVDELQQYRQRVPRKGQQASDPSVLRTCAIAERVFLEWVDGKRTLAEIGENLRMGDLDTVRIVNKLMEQGLLAFGPDEEADEHVLETIVEVFNRVLNLIYSAIEDDLARAELRELGKEFVKSGGHSNEDLSKLVLNKNYEFDLDNIRLIADGARAGDRKKQMVMVLAEYVSFALFNATSFLPIAEQKELSARAYDMLSVFSTY